ncbi:MAG: hypothetical protein WCG25_07350 [bacterium]
MYNDIVDILEAILEEPAFGVVFAFVSVPAEALVDIVNHLPAISEVIVTLVVASTAVTRSASLVFALIAAVRPAVTLATVAAVAVKLTVIPSIIAVYTPPITTAAGVVSFTCAVKEAQSRVSRYKLVIFIASYCEAKVNLPNSCSTLEATNTLLTAELELLFAVTVPTVPTVNETELTVFVASEYVERTKPFAVASVVLESLTSRDVKSTCKVPAAELVRLPFNSTTTC